MNINIIKKNFQKLGIEMKTFFTLLYIVDKNGHTKIKKNAISKYLKVSPQTVGKYIKTFVDCEMIKYKYSGELIINPDFYYAGDVENLASVREQYQNFKSDM